MCDRLLSVGARSDALCIVARRRSLWSEFLRAQERQRQDLVRERWQIEASARRAEQAMERAQRSAQRQARADAREQERLRLIEDPELKHLLEQHLGLQVRIGLDRQPPPRKEPPAR